MILMINVRGTKTRLCEPAYLVCVRAYRDPKGSRQTKVSQLDLPLRIDEEVLGLQVSMENSVRVAEGQALQQLEKITLRNTHTHT